MPDTSAPRGYRCLCAVDNYGESCENTFDACKRATNPCNRETGHGVCLEVRDLVNLAAYTCKCGAQYDGDQCERVVHTQCDDALCRRVDTGAVCVASSSGFRCKCSPGFAGDSCMTNVDDCATANAPLCQNGGRCVDGVASFSCVCDDDRFTGEFCERAKICSLCATNETQFCDNSNGMIPTVTSEYSSLTHRVFLCLYQ